MTINERIREIRKAEKLTQQDFADKIGLKHGAISKMEIDGNTITEQNRQIICEKFHISRRWLDEGIGEMKAPAHEPDIYDTMREKFSLNKIEENILRLYFKLDVEDREAVCEFIRKIGDEKPEQIAPVHRITPEERARRHAELDAEMDAEERGNSSALPSGNVATGTDD